MRLMNKTKNIVLSDVVEQADNMFSRMKGLLGRSNLEPSRTLFISDCNSIHTYFMKFAIDVVFVDKDLKVKSIRQNIQPWGIILPILGAKSVFEFAAGVIQDHKVSLGDQLHVGN